MPSPLETVPDPISRGAMEEVFIPGACKFAHTGYALSPGGEIERDFPPEPAEIVSVSASYLREGAPDGIKREFVALSETLPSTNAAVRLHRDSVDVRQRNMPRLVSVTGEVMGWRSAYEIRKYCIDTVRAQGRRLLAAHVIARVQRDNSLIDALVVPRGVSENIPLLLRDKLVSLSESLAPEDPLRKKIQPLLQRGDVVGEPAAIAAASFLPNSSIIGQALEQTRILRSRLR